jgi:hypothetical protein
MFNGGIRAEVAPSIRFYITLYFIIRTITSFKFYALYLTRERLVVISWQNNILSYADYKYGKMKKLTKFRSSSL